MAKRPSGSRRGGGKKGNEAEDAFVAKVHELTRWSQENTTTLVLFGVALAIVVGSVAYYVNYRENLEQTALTQLEQIQQNVTMGDRNAAKADLTQYLQRFGGTPYASEARLTLAEIYLEDDQADQAIETLEAGDLSSRNPMAVQLQNLLAKAYEETDRLEEAERTYLEVAERAEMDFLEHEALDDAARIRMLQGDARGAVELYEQILDELEPSDSERPQYEMRRGEARAAAAATG